MSSPSDQVADAVTGIVDDARAKAAHAAENITAMASDVTEQIRVGAAEASSQAHDALDDPRGFVRRQLRDNPAVVVAVAAIASFILGAVLARKSNS